MNNLFLSTEVQGQIWDFISWVRGGPEEQCEVAMCFLMAPNIWDAGRACSPGPPLGKGEGAAPSESGLVLSQPFADQRRHLSFHGPWSLFGRGERTPLMNSARTREDQPIASCCVAPSLTH